MQHSALETLAVMLRDADAEPVVVPERIAISTIYDLQYRLFIVACAFRAHAESDLLGTRRMPAAKLKLIQFVAIRPWLLQTVQEWAETRHRPQFQTLHAHTLRRGYVGDTTHDRVIDYLVARDILLRTGAHIVSSTRFSTIDSFATAAETTQSFVNERATIDELREVKITAVMLESA
ncbi:MAG: hypothetical protein QOC81_109 [Thermoanaerobaculia bacterium]|jgi:hypothetical protein|nr:hypothetical protein [Thermoanaerobaculia bacterium]